MKKFSILTVSLILCTGYAIVVPTPIRAQSRVIGVQDYEVCNFIDSVVTPMNEPKQKEIILSYLDNKCSDFNALVRGNDIFLEFTLDPKYSLSDIFATNEDKNSFCNLFTQRYFDKSLVLMKDYGIGLNYIFKDSNGNTLSHIKSNIKKKSLADFVPDADIYITEYVKTMNSPEIKKVLVESGSFSNFSVYNNDRIITHEIIFDDGMDLSQLSQSEKDQLLNSFKFAFMSQLQEETVSFMKAHDIVFLIKFKDKKGHSISTNTF